MRAARAAVVLCAVLGTASPAAADHGHGHWHTNRIIRVCATGNLRPLALTALKEWKQAGLSNGYRLDCRTSPKRHPERRAPNITFGWGTGPFDGQANMQYAFLFPLSDMSAHLERCSITINPDTAYPARVVLHETGHCLGLVHSRDPASIMAASAGDGITAHDRDEIRRTSAPHRG